MIATLTQTKLGQYWIDCQECHDCYQLRGVESVREAGRIVDDHNRVHGHVSALVGRMSA